VCPRSRAVRSTPTMSHKLSRLSGPPGNIWRAMRCESKTFDDPRGGIPASAKSWLMALTSFAASCMISGASPRKARRPGPTSLMVGLSLRKLDDKPWILRPQ